MEKFLNNIMISTYGKFKSFPQSWATVLYLFSGPFQRIENGAGPTYIIDESMLYITNLLYNKSIVQRNTIFKKDLALYEGFLLCLQH